MTISEFISYFKILYDQKSADDVSGIENEEIEAWLNLAQRQELEYRYDRLIGNKRVKFEASERARRELSNLITSETINSASFDSTKDDLHNNAFFVTLSSNYLYGIEERCTTSDHGVIKVVPMTHDEYIENIDNPFLEPYEEVAWRMDFGFDTVTGEKKHEIIHSSDVTVDSYTVRYIRRPQKIQVSPEQDCELDESLHENIVSRAVNLALSPQAQQQQQ